MSFFKTEHKDIDNIVACVPPRQRGREILKMVAAPIIAAVSVVPGHDVC